MLTASRRRAGAASPWRPLLLTVVVVVAASQVRLLVRGPLEVGISADVTWSLLAVAAGLIFWWLGPTVYAGPVPGGHRHRYRPFERANLCLLAWTWKTLAAAALVAAIGLLFDPGPLPDQTVPAGSTLGEVVAASWNDAVAPAFAEELLYRYLLLRFLLAHFSVRWAVLLQALAFGVAHSALGLGGGLIESSGSYPVDAAVSAALGGVLFGFLTVELGTIWPAVIVHAVGNWLITVEDVAPMLLRVVGVVVAAWMIVAAARGVAGMKLAVPLPLRRRLGLSVDRQRRLVRRFGPLVGTAPEFRRPFGWAAPRAMASRPDPDYAPVDSDSRS